MNSDRTGTHDTDKHRIAVSIDTIWEMWKYNCVIVTSLDHVRFRLHRVRHREGLVLRPEPLGGEREGGVAGQLPLDQLHPGAWAGRVSIISCHHPAHLLLTSRLLLPEVLGVVVADCQRPGAAPHQVPAQLHLRGGDGGQADGGCEEDLLGDHADTALYCTVLYCTVLYCTVLYADSLQPARGLL